MLSRKAIRAIVGAVMRETQGRADGGEVNRLIMEKIGVWPPGAVLGHEVVAETAERVIVQYAGQQVETGRVPEIFEAPRHPYTHALLAALPRYFCALEQGGKP
mgnify:CR=1 FL=1